MIIRDGTSSYHLKLMQVCNKNGELSPIFGSETKITHFKLKTQDIEFNSTYHLQLLDVQPPVALMEHGKENTIYS